MYFRVNYYVSDVEVSALPDLMNWFLKMTNQTIPDITKYENQ